MRGTPDADGSRAEPLVVELADEEDRGLARPARARRWTCSRGGVAAGRCAILAWLSAWCMRGFRRKLARMEPRIDRLFFWRDEEDERRHLTCGTHHYLGQCANSEHQWMYAHPYGLQKVFDSVHACIASIGLCLYAYRVLFFIAM
ncbi:hypothetical protein SEVIR_3G235200v4 [Setaria viridis]